MFTTDERRMTNDEGQNQIAIGHLSDLRDLKNLNIPGVGVERLNFHPLPPLDPVSGFVYPHKN